MMAMIMAMTGGKAPKASGINIRAGLSNIRESTKETETVYVNGTIFWSGELPLSRASVRIDFTTFSSTQHY